MYICKIEKDGKQYRIYGENGYEFSLYYSEVKRYHIEEQCELDEDVLQDIYQTVLYKRVRERALYLLERRPYSILDMKNKLKKNQYPEQVIARVIDFLVKYHYLDDVNYAELYVSSYSNRKSQRQMQYELAQKGIDKDVIVTCLSQKEDSEQECFQIRFERYIQGKDMCDFKVRQKVYRYFYSKGFPGYMIEQALDAIRYDVE